MLELITLNYYQFICTLNKCQWQDIIFFILSVLTDLNFL